MSRHLAKVFGTAGSKFQAKMPKLTTNEVRMGVKAMKRKNRSFTPVGYPETIKLLDEIEKAGLRSHTPAVRAAERRAAWVIESKEAKDLRHRERKRSSISYFLSQWTDKQGKV